MKGIAALAGGLAGTLTVAALHEALKRISPDAPRMDVLDRELIKKGLASIHQPEPGENALQRWAVGGELFADTAYYSVAGLGGSKSAWTRGALLGLFAGITAVVLPKPLGLPSTPSNKTLATQLMTVGLYLAGGLVAAAVSQVVEKAQTAPQVEEADEPVRRKTYDELPAGDFVL